MAGATRYGVTGLAEEVEFGKGGPTWAATAGLLEARSSVGGSRSVVRCADPIGVNDAVTLGSLTTTLGGYVTAAAVFAVDERLLRADGAGRGAQASAIACDDSGNLSGVGTIGCGAITSSGTLALSANSITMTGSIGTTGARVTKGWFVDLEVTNAIAGSITGNAATVTVAPEAADTTCSPLFATAPNGSLAPKTSTGWLWNASTMRMQIGGTTAPSDTLNVMAAASGGAASLGAELLLNGTFDSDLSDWTAGANWAWGAGGTADHSAGSVETLTQTVATTSGTHYQVVVVLSAVSASNVVMTLTSSSGGESFTLSSATTYTYSFKAGTASSTLTFTPNTAFVGSITSVSMKAITPATVYALATMDSAGGRSGLCSVATAASRNNCLAGLGAGVLYTTGVSGTAFGRSAAASNTVANETSAFGYYALTANQSGGANSAFGANCLIANTIGAANSAFGRSAMASNVDGMNSVAFGYNAGRYYSTGTDALTSVSYGVYIGSNARANANTMTNEIVIGYNAVGNGSNTATIGNTSLTDVYTSGRLVATRTTEQLRLRYDAANYCAWTVSSAGVLTIDPSGTHTRLDGSLYVGGTGAAPTAVLHLKAGTATAGTAPLKFTDGTLLGTAEEGAEELDLATRWMTPISTQREAVVGVLCDQYETVVVSYEEHPA